ncbi:hypothetical protein FIBSPDRAFT_854066, partial [Athelia psychrophila]
MTTHGLPAKLTTTDRCTSRPSTARFFSRGPSIGAEGPNVDNYFSGKMSRRETRCDSKPPSAAFSQYLSTHPAQPRILWNHNCPGGPRRRI